MKRTSLCMAVLLCVVLAFAAAAAERPNVVVIMADDLGRGDLACFGGEFPTPRMDSLAAGGMKFEQFYVAAPVCTPSRFGLLTGRYPNRSRDHLMHALMFLDPRDDTRGLREGETTVAARLQSIGYRTAVIGKWHLGHGLPEFAPERHGFDVSYGSQGGCVDYFNQCYGQKPDWWRGRRPVREKGYTTDLITDEAVGFLKKQSSRRPFFLFLAYTAPHYGKGWNAADRTSTNVLQAKPEHLARLSGIADEKRRVYAGMVAAMDEGVGRVLDTLRKKKLESNTLVIFVSDNGGDPRYGGDNRPFRGQKAQLFEGGIRVPCLMRWPGKITPGNVSTQPASCLDVFPTLCRLCGVDAGITALDGCDLSPVLLGNAAFERSLFWRFKNGDAFRQGPWKYLRTGKNEMLFNLDDDPGEQNNLAGRFPERLEELKQRHAAIAATLPQPPTKE